MLQQLVTSDCATNCKNVERKLCLNYIFELNYIIVYYILYYCIIVFYIIVYLYYKVMFELYYIIELYILELKGLSGRKFFCLVFSQKNLTDLKTKFTQVKLSTTFRFQDLPS